MWNMDPFKFRGVFVFFGGEGFSHKNIYVQETLEQKFWKDNYQIHLSYLKPIQKLSGGQNERMCLNLDKKTLMYDVSI